MIVESRINKHTDKNVTSISKGDVKYLDCRMTNFDALDQLGKYYFMLLFKFQQLAGVGFSDCNIVQEYLNTLSQISSRRSLILQLLQKLSKNKI